MALIEIIARPRNCLFCAKMVRTYSLVHPVIAFSRDEKRIVTIPAGALIRVVVVPRGIGITSTVFEGLTILLQYQDIERNGVEVAHSEKWGY
jgi:hypothetical protein